MFHCTNCRLASNDGLHCIVSGLSLWPWAWHWFRSFVPSSDWFTGLGVLLWLLLFWFYRDLYKTALLACKTGCLRLYRYGAYKRARSRSCASRDCTFSIFLQSRSIQKALPFFSICRVMQLVFGFVSLFVSLISGHSRFVGPHHAAS